MKKLYSLLMFVAMAALSVSAKTVQLEAEIVTYNASDVETGEVEAVFDAEIDGSTITIKDVPCVGDIRLQVIADGSVGYNLQAKWYYGSFQADGIPTISKLYVYNSPDDEAFGYEVYDGVKYIWSTYYGETNSDYTYVDIDFALPDDFEPRAVGEDLSASATANSGVNYYDAGMTGTFFDDHIELSSIFGYPCNADIYFDSQTGKATTTISQAWNNGYYEFNGASYIYLRDYYQGSYHAVEKDVYGRYIKLYLELANSASTQLWVYIYLPDDEESGSAEEQTIEMKTWTAYNSNWTSYTVPVKVVADKYTIENFLDSDFRLEVMADASSKGTISTNLPTDRLKKNFYIDGTKFTYMAEHSESDNEWVDDAIAFYFQLYSSSIGSWTWVTTYIYPNTLSGAGVSNVTVDDDNAAVEMFNLNGVRMSSDNLPAGLYIRRQGSKVSKVVIR